MFTCASVPNILQPSPITSIERNFSDETGSFINHCLLESNYPFCSSIMCLFARERNLAYTNFVCEFAIFLESFLNLFKETFHFLQHGHPYVFPIDPLSQQWDFWITRKSSIITPNDDCFIIQSHKCTCRHRVTMNSIPTFHIGTHKYWSMINEAFIDEAWIRPSIIYTKPA
jgi:hypothetical protein